MKRSITRIPLVAEPNKWHGNDKNGVWEYGDYRCCYLVIRRLENGKFRPNLGACGDVSFPGMPLPAEGYFQYDTFKQAENHLFAYVDWLRDEWDTQAKVELYERLIKLNPRVFLV